jgi:hypothetical protein
VPRDSEDWNDASCAAAFEMLAGSPSFETYVQISPLGHVELTRGEFIKLLRFHDFGIPAFWGRSTDAAIALKNVPANLIEKAISDVPDYADTSDAKPPNINELDDQVQNRLGEIRSQRPAGQLKKPSKVKIRAAIKLVYQNAALSKQKPPNINELPTPVQSVLTKWGYTASALSIKQVGGEKEFQDCRVPVGKTMASYWKGQES